MVDKLLEALVIEKFLKDVVAIEGNNIIFFKIVILFMFLPQTKYLIEAVSRQEDAFKMIFRMGDLTVTSLYTPIISLK